MALDFQTVSLSLTQGIDTKSDPKSVVIGKLLTLENAVFTKPGELLKRYGYAPMTRNILASSGSPALSVGTNINEYSGNVIVSDGNYVYAYTSEAAKWSKAEGQISSTKLEVSEIASGFLGLDLTGSTTETINILTSRAVASDGTEGYVVVTPAEPSSFNSQVQFIAYSAGNKTITYSVTKTYSSGTTYARTATIQAVGNTFYVFVAEQTSAVPAYAVKVYSFTTTPVTTFPAGTSISTGNFTRLDSAVLSTNIYLIADGGVLIKYNTSGGAVSTGATAGTGSALSISTDSSTSRIWTSVVSTTTIYVESFNTSLVSQTATSVAVANASSTGIASDSGRVVAFADRRVWVLGGTLTEFPTIHVNGHVAAKPVFDSTSFYVVFRTVSSTQSTYFLCSAILGVSDTIPTFGQIQSKWGEANAVSQDSGAVAGPTATQSLIISSGVISTGFLIQKDTTYYSGSGTFTYTSVPLLALCRAQVTLSQKAMGILGGKVLNYLCGSPSFYDNKRTIDIGFNQYPTAPILTQASGLFGGVVTAGVHSCIVLYSYIDSKGQVTRSAPGPAAQITVVGGKYIVAVCDVPSFTNKNQVLIELYRTAVGGTTYHVTASQIVGSPNGNFTSGSTVTIIDNTPDEPLVENRQLYTNGGEVDNIVPPSSRIGCIYKTRMMLVPDEFRTSIWYSKDVIPGAPVEFSDLFVMNVDPRGGDITALAQLDDKLIIFKRDVILYTAGSGPSPNGLNNDFQEPLLIASDTGCSDRDSVVVTPLGVFFKSPKGIYLLGRNLNLEYKGAEVESFNSYSVTSATLIEDKNQVRFTLNTSSFLVYDYFAGQWSVFKPLTAVDACTYGSTFAYLDSSGFVYNETPNLFLDGSSAISMKLVTGWLTLAKLQGFQRVRKLLFLGDYKSAHTLTVQFAHDFGSVSQTTVVTPTVDQVPYQWDVALVRQKSQAVQLTIYDTPTAPYGESLSLSTLSFEVGIKRGLNKVKAAWST